MENGVTALEALRQALRLILAHPMRSFLTLFGIVWGTAAVIFLMSWGAGLQTMLDDATNRVGKNLVVAFPGRISDDYSPAFDRRWLYYTVEDIENVRKRSREADLVAGETQRWLAAAYAQRAVNIDVRGVDPLATRIRGVSLASGRGIRPTDVEHRRRVVVLGHRARRDLLGHQGGIGSWVRIMGNPFQVVGVLDRVGTQLSRDGDEIDDQAWVPISTHLALWPNTEVDEDVVRSLLIRIEDKTRVKEAKEEVRAILADRLRVAPDDEEAIPMFSPLDLLETLPIGEQNASAVFIAGTTLLIGGIGILSMMLDSVRERRAEIGMRLAVGARRRDIVWQFFLETFAVVLLGGVVGVALGALGVLLLGSDMIRTGIPPAQLDLLPVPELEAGMVLAASGVMVTVGLAAGLLPAWRAARIDPAETLRAD